MDVRKVNGVPSSVLHDGNSDDGTLFSNVGTDTLYGDRSNDRLNGGIDADTIERRRRQRCLCR